MAKKISEIFQSRADAQENRAKQHWAAAKNGDGDYNYGMAKREYGWAKENQEKADFYKKQGK